ncbi:MAG: hypothetical protein K0S38_473 [Candidatus Paceibacter sp.]|nr:hypothetical protein [Candidatus Paceibacter sp.]
MDGDRITYFAETDARNRRIPFGIKAEDRSRHLYVIGKTGMGKSTLLENMAIQDIKNGEGMAFLDPHGKTADLLLDYIPQERIKDVIYFAPFDLDFPISFNVMEDVGHDKRHLVANGLMSAFKKIWVDAWSARMEYILNNILLALLEYPDATLIGVNRMLADKDYRNKVVDNITDPSVKSFWQDEFAKYGDRYMQEAGAAIQNKIGQFVSNPLVRNIIGQPKSTFDIRHIMDEKKILIINLSKGMVGEANANLLGAMLITKIYLGAMSRADASPGLMKRLPPFYLYVDEFQNFANESFADILSEARKYKLALSVAHQYIEQMTDEVRAAVFGNVGSMMVFRVGAFDAEVIEKEFAPTFTQEDIVNLGRYQLYLKLMIDGVTSQPFSATTLPPIEKPLVNFKEDIIKFSRATYARPRASVEDGIKKWHETSQKMEEPRRREGLPRTGGSAGMGGGRDLKEAIRHTQASREARPEARPEIRTEARPESRPRENPHEAKDRPPEEMKSGLRNALRDAQERELRNAITENYKKNVAEDEKRKEIVKKEKGPQPENISALREALASVLKEANFGIIPQQKPETKPETKTETKSEPKVEAKPEFKPEPKIESKPDLTRSAQVEIKPQPKPVPAQHKPIEPHKPEAQKPQVQQNNIHITHNEQHIHVGNPQQKQEPQREQKPEQRPEQKPHPQPKPEQPKPKPEPERKEEQPRKQEPQREQKPPRMEEETREVPEEILRRILEHDK